MVLSLTLLISHSARRCVLLNVCILLVSIFVSPAHAQSGGGTDIVGTGGRHVIKGRLYFPSGRRTDTGVPVKLVNMIAGNLSVMADANGSFTFRGLNSGSYTVVVEGGDDYETSQQVVYIETDGVTARRGIVQPRVSRVYTVDISLRLKPATAVKPGVINAALAAVPVPARELYESALRSAQASNHKKAVDELNQALSIYANFPLALNELGMQYLKLNQPDKAAGSFSTALKLSPGDSSMRINYGYALMQSNRAAEAEAELRQALKKNDNSWPGHMYLGMALLRLRRLDESEVELRRALSLSGVDLAMPHYYLGGIYWAKNDFKRAADELEKYVKLAPGAPDVERIRTTIKELRLKK